MTGIQPLTVVVPPVVLRRVSEAFHHCPLVASALSAAAMAACSPSPSSPSSSSLASNGIGSVVRTGRGACVVRVKVPPVGLPVRESVWVVPLG